METGEISSQDQELVGFQAHGLVGSLQTWEWARTFYPTQGLGYIQDKNPFCGHSSTLSLLDGRLLCDETSPGEMLYTHVFNPDTEFTTDWYLV